jgi:hypothetical protein
MFSLIKKEKFKSCKIEYQNPKTSLLYFSFDPINNQDIEKNLQESFLQRVLISDKVIYSIDDFYLSEDAVSLQKFSENATFSRNSYGSIEGIQDGEKPAKSMDGKERWLFFSNPPKPIEKVYQFLSYLSHHLKCEVMTMPWELFDGQVASPATIANFVDEVSVESMKKGRHKDYNSLKGLPFTIPNLFSNTDGHQTFENGATGKPYLLSLMIYSCSENFLPEYEMGTIFYSDCLSFSISSKCKNMRMVLFEGDIDHSIAKSNFSAGIKTWRVSYVYKLIFNPKKEDQIIKQDLFVLLEEKVQRKSDKSEYFF